MTGYALKLTVIALLAIALAAASGYFLKAGLSGAPDASVGAGGAAFIYALVALALYFALFAIQCAIFQNGWTGLVVIILEVAAFAGVFYEQAGSVFAGALAVAAVFLFAGYRAAQRDFQNKLKIRFSSTGGRALHWAERGVAILFAALIALMLASADASQSKQFISASAAAFPGFRSDRSLREVIAGFADKTLSSRLGALPPEARQQVVNEATNQAVQMIGQFTGVRVRTNDNVVDVLYAAITGFLKKIPPLVQNLLLLILGVLLYSFIKMIFALLGWVGGILASLVFNLLVAVKFVQIKVEPRDKEIIAMI